MKITVSRDGAVIGIYDRKDIGAAVAEGSLHPTDWYFTKGMREWLPLSTLTKTLAVRTTEYESTPEHESIPATAKHSWKRAVTSAGYAILTVAALSALLNPNYWSQALSAAAGLMLIFGARTLP
jgi:hypothetical protein